MREPHRRWADLIGGADRRAAKAVEFCFLLRSFFLVRSAGYPSRRRGSALVNFIIIISRVGGQSVLCSIYHWFCRYLSLSLGTVVIPICRCSSQSQNSSTHHVHGLFSATSGKEYQRGVVSTFNVTLHCSRIEHKARQINVTKHTQVKSQHSTTTQMNESDVKKKFNGAGLHLSRCY